MKKLTLLLSMFLCLCIGKVSAKDIIINQPVYEFKNTGISNVSKIELRKNETRVYIHKTFVPKMWVMFDRKIYLEDCDTGEKWTVTGIEKGEFDKKIYMPASGDSTFILIFPPLNKQVKKINYMDDKAGIYAISLNPKEKPVQDKGIPSEVTQWMETELAKAPARPFGDIDRKNFFRKDTARIIGYIRGYSPKSGIKTALTHVGNNLTREDCPVVIEIFEDGRFEGKLPISYPIYNNFYIKDEAIPFYIEPGQTLGVIVDWDDCLKADRYRNIRYKFELTRYSGPLGQINSELAAAERRIPELDFRALRDKGFPLGIKEFPTFAESATAVHRNTLQQFIQDESLHPTTRTVLRMNQELVLPYWLFTYDMDKIRRSKDTLDTTGFYDFLKKMPLNDPAFLVSPNSSVVLNRFEYSTPFSELTGRLYIKPEKSFEEYLFQELGLKPTEEDLIYQKADPGKDRDSWEAYRKLQEAFYERHSSQQTDYSEKYIKPLKQPTMAELILDQWYQKDSIYSQVLALQPSLMYDITKVRFLKSRFESTKKREEAREYKDKLMQTVDQPFLKQEAERLFKQYFPLQPSKAYELPASEKGTAIFRKAIDPHKGKYVFVDFWATTCGPCVAGIKQMKETRAKYKDHPEIAFVFLTNEQESPAAAYQKFIGEQDMEFTHRLPNDEFAYLRQLFAFNGIPHYVLVDKEGKIMNGNYWMEMFQGTIKDLELEK